MRGETHDPSWGETTEKREGSRNVKFQICCALEKPLPQQLTLLTASRSLRPDMVLGTLREQRQSPAMQAAKAGIAGWTRSTPPDIHVALAALLSIP